MPPTPVIGHPYVAAGIVLSRSEDQTPPELFHQYNGILAPVIFLASSENKNSIAATISWGVVPVPWLSTSMART